LPGLPAGFVGNASTTAATPSFKSVSSITGIAAIIDQILDPLRQKPSPELEELLSINFNAMKHRLSYFPFNVPGIHAKKPTVAYINNFSKLPIYDLDFGSGKPEFVIPHDLLDQVLIWPAHPGKGGVEVYFSGIPARMISRLSKGDSWLASLK